MTARTILLALICSAVSATLAAQEAKDDSSKKDETPKTERNDSFRPGQIPMIFGFPSGQQGQNPWTFGGQPGNSGEKDDKKDGKQDNDPWKNTPWGRQMGGFGGFGGGPGTPGMGGGFGGGPGTPGMGGGFGGGPVPSFNPWDDGPMFFGGDGNSLFGMGNPWNDGPSDSNRSGRSGRLFGLGNPWIDSPTSMGFGGFGGFGGGPGTPGMGGGFGGGFGGGPGFGGFGGGPGNPGMGGGSRNMSMIDMIPEEERERLVKLMQTDPTEFRAELKKLVSGQQENEYKAAMELREKYFKATTTADKNKIKAELRELISVRFDTYNRSAERQIAETEETIASAQKRLDILKKQHEERVQNADILIDSTVDDYLNPDKEPTFEEALRKQNEQSARSNLPGSDRMQGGRNGGGQHRGGQGGGQHRGG